jgi:hypothetical protein
MPVLLVAFLAGTRKVTPGGASDAFFEKRFAALRGRSFEGD